MYTKLLFLYNQIMIKILLAEDGAEWQKVHKTLMNDYFNGDEYTLCIESCARDACERLKQEKFDAVITDLQMELDFEPDFAGEWLVKQIKQMEEYKNTPVLIVSATYNIGFVASRLGVNYLSKRTLLSMPDSYRYAMNELLGFNK